LRDFDPAHDRSGSDSVLRRPQVNVRIAPKAEPLICALMRTRPSVMGPPGRGSAPSSWQVQIDILYAVTAMPCTSIIISGWAKPCTVIAALAGKSLPNSSVRSSVMRVV